MGYILIMYLAKTIRHERGSGTGCLPRFGKGRRLYDRIDFLLYSVIGGAVPEVRANECRIHRLTA